MEQIIQEILNIVDRDREGSKTRPYIIAIDGRCGAGKTTLATALTNSLDANLFHMDDFFLRPEQRCADRLAIPGENIDHERFLHEVLLPLRQGICFSYAPFSCVTQTLCPPIVVTPKPIAIVEGSYALHPLLREHYDQRIFLTVDPATQESRIRTRNGESIWPMFRDRWIPLEELYIRHCQVQETADAVYMCIGKHETIVNQS